MIAFLDSIRDGSFNIGAPAGGFMIVMALLGYFKGVVKQFLTLVSAGGGFYTGWWVFQNLPSMLADSGMTDMAGTTLFGFSSLAGGIVFGLLRVLSSWLGNLLGLLSVFSKLFGRGGGKGIVGAVSSLIPSSALVLLSGSVLRFGGAVEDLNSTSQVLQDPTGQTEKEAGFLTGISRSINRSVLGNIYETQDPTHDLRTRKLAELMLISGDDTAWGKLSNRPDTRPILTSPAVSQLFGEATLAEAAARGDVATIFSHDGVRKASQLSPTAEQLDELDLAKVISEVLEAERTERRARFK